MQSIFGIEISSAGRYLIAFVAIFALLALLALVLRRVTGARMKLGGQGSARSRQPRLGIVDVYDLDRQRQLLLLRRDNVEHLVMIGGPNDVVVESNIVRGQAARVPGPATSAEAGAERSAPPEIVPERRSDTLVPRLASEQPGPAARAAPLDLRSAGKPVPASIPGAVFSEATLASAELGAVTVPAVADVALRPSPTEPSRADQSRLTEMTRQLEEALKRPFSAVRPSPAVEAQQEARREPQDGPSEPDAPSRQPLAKPMDGEAAGRESDGMVRAAGERRVGPLPEEPASAAPIARPGIEGRGDALAPRSAPGGEAPGPVRPADRPARALSSPPGPGSVDADETPAAERTRPRFRDRPPRPNRDELRAESGRADRPLAAPATAPALAGAPPIAAAPGEPSPGLEDQTPAGPAKDAGAAGPGAQPETADQAVGGQGPAKELDPFSAEAIEAEFARLLGRTLTKPGS